MYIFCYGTLKSGYGNWSRLLDGRSTLVSSGTLQGFKLFDSGFPVATPSEGDSVYGEVFLVDPDKEVSVLRSLDGLEGYYPDSMETCMYHRVSVSVLGDDDQSYNCQTYQGNPRFWRDFKGMNDVKKDEFNRYFWSR